MSAHALVYGGAGALGRAVVGRFRKSQWTVTSVDFSPNADATHNVILDQSMTSDLEKSGLDVESRVLDAWKGSEGSSNLSAVVNVAGGWAGGNFKDDALYKNVTLMMSQSMNTSVISARLAAKHLREGGLLAVVGAAAALEGTPEMQEWLVAYGATKAAVHQLIQSAAAPGSGLPSNTRAVAIMPITLDTPMNRKFMPDADHSTWTPLETVAEKLADWASGKEVVTNGALYEIVTKKGNTEWVNRA
ncbi:hypothetical protein PhCBS80983_g02229 [Powellomyces hirtus]|uniref:Dihydropteridine reductase n=1 Tax=Powellomyces hirtus TaxID=109895 RepID=A0A507E7I2_9FUNG|nr:hypothetical protein PhCBS80983_g02229 [Powellomyces hirtus]